MKLLFRSILLLFVLLPVTIWSATDEAAKHETLWELVAQAPLIAKGTLRVPVQAIEKLRDAGKHAYMDLQVENAEFFKGNASEAFVIRWYTDDKPYAPDLALLKNLDGRTVVIFAVRAGPPKEREIYFAGHTPEALVLSSEATLHDVQNEISKQKTLLSQFPKGLPSIPKLKMDTVRQLLNDIAVQGKAESAFKELLRLGQEGVPATIMLMDDRRAVAAEWLQLENPPGHGHWEAYALYKPEKVIDALDGILIHITGQSYGNIVNGGTEEDRRAVLDGWRVYLYHLR